MIRDCRKKKSDDPYDLLFSSDSEDGEAISR